MDPKPQIASVCPMSPLAFPWVFLFQTPCLKSEMFSKIWRSQFKMCPMTSSATAMAFRPGQLATKIPFEDAVVKSMVFTPAPARIIKLREGHAFKCSAVTFVERTTKTSGAWVRSASVSASPFKDGRLQT